MMGKWKHRLGDGRKVTGFEESSDRGENGYVWWNCSSECIVWQRDIVEVQDWERGVNVFQTSCQSSMGGVAVRDRLRNEDIRIGHDMKYMLSERVNLSVVRWYGHLKRSRWSKSLKQEWVEPEEEVDYELDDMTDGVIKVLGERGMIIDHPAGWEMRAI